MSMTRADQRSCATWSNPCNRISCHGRIGHGLGDYMTTGDNLFLAALRKPLKFLRPSTEPGDTIALTKTESAARLIRDWSGGYRGGNYLLNVGPDGNGEIPAQSVEVLRQSRFHEQQRRKYLRNGSCPCLSLRIVLGWVYRSQEELYIHVFEPIMNYTLLTWETVRAAVSCWRTDDPLNCVSGSPVKASTAAIALPQMPSAAGHGCRRGREEENIVFEPITD